MNRSFLGTFLGDALFFTLDDEKMTSDKWGYTWIKLVNKIALNHFLWPVIHELLLKTVLLFVYNTLKFKLTFQWICICFVSAPEVQTSSICSVLSDMFSLGMVICAIFNQGRPLIQANHSSSAYLKQLELVSDRLHVVTKIRIDTLKLSIFDFSVMSMFFSN